MGEMSHHLARLGIVLALAFGSSASQPPSVSQPGLLNLPTVSSPEDACAGIGLFDSTLTGSPLDPRVAWLEFRGRRRDVVFPPGFHARFTPGLEILDQDGGIVARGGDSIDGACVTGDAADEPLLILYGK